MVQVSGGDSYMTMAPPAQGVLTKTIRVRLRVFGVGRWALSFLSDVLVALPFFARSAAGG
jgi:hypothetical protein